jgi:c-di-GMP-binding flagellar brake protein YcgR
MVKRPFTIILISLIYLFSPFLVILQAAVVNRVPIVGYHSVFSLFLVSDIIVLFIYMVCAVSVFFVRKWGWYTFISSSLFLISYNFVTLALNPRNSLISIIAYDFILTVAAFIFFRKNLIAPFFNPKLRWWETEPRYVIGISLELRTGTKSTIAEVVDLSESGCYILPVDGLEVGGTYDAKLNCMGDSVLVRARLLRKSFHSDGEQGFGMMFTETDTLSRQGLARIILKLKKAKFIKTKAWYTDRNERTTRPMTSRYLVRNTAVLHSREGEVECSLVNLSRNGCMLRTEKILPLDIPYKLYLQCADSSTKTFGVISWKVESDANGKSDYGIRFLKYDPASSKGISRIVRYYTEVGAINRLKMAKPVDEDVIEESVAHTPYKIIATMRKLIMGQRD